MLITEYSFLVNKKFINVFCVYDIIIKISFGGNLYETH